MDEHAPKGVFDKDIKPTRFINFPGAYTIPYRCYCAKNVDNLMMAGRDISVTKMALGSTRVMGTCAVGGQAAGTAAAMAVAKGCAPRDISSHIRQLQQALIKDDCYIPGFINEDIADMAREARITATSAREGREARSVVSGVARTVGSEANCWESEPLSSGAQILTLAFDKPRGIRQIRITFDPNLSREIMISMTRTVQNREVKHMPPEMVKRFRVRALLGDTSVFQAEIDDNNRRLCVLDLPNQCPMADRVEISVLETYGYESARVFEVRIY